MSKNSRLSLSEIRHLFMNEEFIYIRIYGATKALHLLPKIVTDHIILMEFSYQSYYHDTREVLNIKKEQLWPYLAIIVRAYNKKLPLKHKGLEKQFKIFTSMKKDSKEMILKIFPSTVCVPPTFHGITLMIQA